MSVGVDKEAAFSTYTGRRGCGYAAVYVCWGGEGCTCTHTDAATCTHVFNSRMRSFKGKKKKTICSMESQSLLTSTRGRVWLTDTRCVLDPISDSPPLLFTPDVFL